MKRSARDKTKIMTGLVALALTLTACGGGDNGDNGGGEPKELTQAPVVTTHSDVVEPVTMALNGRLTTLDPLLVTATQDVRLLQIAAGKLFELNPDGSGVRPSIASASELSDDGLTYTITLEEDPTFTDGSPLTSEDVVATLQRAMEYESNAYVAQISPVESVTAVDDGTVEIVFERAFPSFETFLAYPNMAILKADEIADDLTIPKTPIFAGGYSVEGDFTSNSFQLQRYDDFVGDVPAVETMDVSVITDANTRVQQVKTGQVDFAVDPLPSQVSNLGEGALPQVTESIGFYYLNMNNNGALQDPNLRKAINAAVDRKQITAVTTGGYADAQSGFFPAVYTSEQTQETEVDVEASRELLQGTDCEDGCELSVMVSEEWSQTVAVIVQQNLAAIGIDVSIENVEDQVAIQRQFEGDFDMSVALFGDYSSAPEGLPAYCLQASAGYLSCLSGYDSSEAEEAVVDLSQALTEDEAKAAEQRVEEIFAKDQPYVTLSGLTAAAVVSPDVAGVLSVGATNLIHVATLS